MGFARKWVREPQVLDPDPCGDKTKSQLLFPYPVTGAAKVLTKDQ